MTRTRHAVGCGLLLSLAAGRTVAQQPSAPILPSNSNAWFEPAEPIRIVGPIYFVGTADLGVYLVTTKAGHVLIDGAMPGSAPLVEASIRKLGFEPRISACCSSRRRTSTTWGRSRTSSSRRAPRSP